MKTISIDIGGTFIKWSTLDEDLNIIDKGKFKTEAFTIKMKGIIVNVAKKINDLVKKYDDIAGVGISIPGIIDSNTGIFLSPTANLPEAEKMNILEELKKSVDIPIKIINDANAAALGEYAIGSLKGFDSGVLITIGTGIGAGFIINGKIYQGNFFSAGEVGRQYVNGERWEHANSTRTLINNVKLITGKDNISGEEVLELTKTDSLVEEKFRLWMSGISIGIANIINIMNPGAISIGGGISENELFDMDLIYNNLKKLTNPEILESTKIVKSSTGNDAALYGVALLVRKELN